MLSCVACDGNITVSEMANIFDTDRWRYWWSLGRITMAYPQIFTGEYYWDGQGDPSP